MKKVNFFLLAFAAFVLASCGAFKTYIANYSVGLSSVESPADAKQQFGETKVVTFNEEGVSKYRYEDDYINIVWYVGLKQFNFTLNNKSGHSLKINWDDISFVDTEGQVGRVMHSGVKYATTHSLRQPFQREPAFQTSFFLQRMFTSYRDNMVDGVRTTFSLVFTRHQRLLMQVLHHW